MPPQSHKVEKRRHGIGLTFLIPSSSLLFVAILYFVSAPESFQGGDAGLFTVISHIGGYAHPPGYPLYSLYLYLSHFFFSSSVLGSSLATAFLGFLAVFGFYLAARSWRITRLPAVFGALLFGLAPSVWLFHVQPEVFALNHLVAVIIFFLASPESPFEGRMRVVLLGLVAGFGISHHHTIVLLFPIGGYAVWRGLKESKDKKILLFGLVGLVVGLSPYFI